ncbi:hypothetical protein ALC57_02727 [Trachymyrmex cornetzi]|uniref:Uncharacterized protein n=1 Tax=Trachymyrmex cornetzi TaxID=471704 RepID=A0A151JN59_9HYME|nr:hypothetical protein ALC57_02727 [Trachymyrmex cornetzi]
MHITWFFSVLPVSNTQICHERILTEDLLYTIYTNSISHIQLYAQLTINIKHASLKLVNVKR